MVLYALYNFFLHNLRIIYFAFLLILSIKNYGQGYNLLNQFNTHNSEILGDYIFDFVEDKNGFIWIATNNGVSRFDGQNFYNYTTKDGLPSNDVLEVFKDQSDCIWVNCFRQVPYYFNEKTNRFVALKGKGFEKIFSDLNFCSFNEKGQMVFMTKYAHKVVDAHKNVSFYDQIELNAGRSKLFRKNGVNVISGESYLSIDNQSVIHSFFKDSERHYYFKNCLFNFRKEVLEKFSDFKVNPFTYKKEFFLFDAPVRWKKFTFDKIYVITVDSFLYVIDFDSFKLIQKIKVDANVICAKLNCKNQLFLGTQNEGIKIYSQGKIQKIETPSQITDENFISVDIDSIGNIYTGNLSGQALNFDGQKWNMHQLDMGIWVRKNLFFGPQVLTISDQYYYINFKNKSHIAYGNSRNAIKNAVKINDSIALLSTINGIYQLNVLKNRVRKLSFPDERVGHIIRANLDEYYVISASGLYIYNYKTNSHQHIFEKYNFFHAAFDGRLLFVNTYKNDLYVFSKNKLIQKIDDSEKLPSGMSKMKFIKNRLWIADKEGLFLLRYRYDGRNFSFDVENISRYDGLNDNRINDFALLRNQVYVTTEHGISIVPSDFSASRYDIKTQIISLKINEKPRPVALEYKLSKDEKVISILFSGVEVTGHFKKFVYRINNGNWLGFSNNLLNLNLKNGTNQLEVKAIDNNGYASQHSLKISFIVATPFYQTLWFWTLMGGLAIGSLIFAYSRWKFAKQKNELNELLNLEQQRNKISANLHDEIGSMLSSLQINSAVVGKIFDKDPTHAKKIVQNIEEQSQSLSEKIGDIIWSMKPGKDEFMSLSMRIKNFSTQIIGATDMGYSIKIDPQIDHLITDFSDRKNILLICKEAINNAVKYSKASKINISLLFDDQQLIIIITDNGIGFNPELIKGNGITNIKERVDELGGTCTFESSENRGTTLKVKIQIIP